VPEDVLFHFHCMLARLVAYLLCRQGSSTDCSVHAGIWLLVIGGVRGISRVYSPGTISERGARQGRASAGTPQAPPPRSAADRRMARGRVRVVPAAAAAVAFAYVIGGCVIWVGPENRGISAGGLIRQNDARVARAAPVPVWVGIPGYCARPGSPEGVDNERRSSSVMHSPFETGL